MMKCAIMLLANQSVQSDWSGLYISNNEKLGVSMCKVKDNSR